MEITDEQAKAALDEGKTLLFRYPAQDRFVGAIYHAWRDNRGTYVCDVQYQHEGHPRPPQWGGVRDFTTFVQSLPRPAQRTDDWHIDETPENGGQQ